MTDEAVVQHTGPTCPWCSADLPSAATAACPSCGATLIGETETPVPGLTTLDPEAIVRGTHPVTPHRSKLLSWITGDEGEDLETEATPGSLGLPPPEVQREMLRMELEAEVLDLQAEADALAAAAREEGLVEDAEVLGTVGDDAAATAADIATPDDPLSGGGADPGPAAAPEAGDPAAVPPAGVMTPEPERLPDRPAAQATDRPPGDTSATA